MASMVSVIDGIEKCASFLLQVIISGYLSQCYLIPISENIPKCNCARFFVYLSNFTHKQEVCLQNLESSPKLNRFSNNSPKANMETGTANNENGTTIQNYDIHVQFLSLLFMII